MSLRLCFDCFTPMLHVCTPWIMSLNKFECSLCLLAACSPADRDRIPDPNKTVSGDSFPRLFFPCFVFLIFFPPPWYRNRCTVRCLSPPGSSVLWVCWGVLQACHPQPSVLAWGKLPSPCGPPRHNWTELVGGSLPVSGQCPGQSQNHRTIEFAGGRSFNPAAIRNSHKLETVRSHRKPATVRGSLPQACRALHSQACRPPLTQARRRPPLTTNHYEWCLYQIK